MRLLLLIATSMALSSCASDGYRYHDAGYYTARARPAVLVVDYGNACGFGFSGFGFSRYGYGRSAYGYPCGSGFGYSLGYGSWHGANYWAHPYWSQPWYAPRAAEHPSAGMRARSWAQTSAAEAAFPRFDDLAPARRRDTGSGGGFGYSQSFGAPADSGMGASTRSASGRNAGIGSGQRGGPRQESQPRHAVPRAAGNAARATRADAQQEE